MGFGIVGDVLGVNKPNLPTSNLTGVFDNERIGEGADEMMDLLIRMFQAAGEGGGDFLKDIFELESGRALGGLAAGRESAFNNLERTLSSSGSGIDESTRAFLMADLDRGFGEKRGDIQRGLATNQALRQEEFPFKVLRTGSPIISSQQQGTTAENSAKFEADFKRTIADFQFDQQRGAAIRKIAGAGATGGFSEIFDKFKGGIPGGGGGGGGGGTSFYDPITDSIQTGSGSVRA